MSQTFSLFNPNEPVVERGTLPILLASNIIVNSQYPHHTNLYDRFLAILNGEEGTQEYKISCYGPFLSNFRQGQKCIDYETGQYYNIPLDKWKDDFILDYSRVFELPYYDEQFEQIYNNVLQVASFIPKMDNDFNIPNTSVPYCFIMNDVDSTNIFKNFIAFDDLKTLFSILKLKYIDNTYEMTEQQKIQMKRFATALLVICCSNNIRRCSSSTSRYYCDSPLSKDFRVVLGFAKSGFSVIDVLTDRMRVALPLLYLCCQIFNI